MQQNFYEKNAIHSPKEHKHGSFIFNNILTYKFKHFIKNILFRKNENFRFSKAITERYLG